MERKTRTLLAATAVICLIVGILIGFALVQSGLMGFLLPAAPAMSP